jgi:hypothetical protein
VALFALFWLGGIARKQPAGWQAETETATNGVTLFTCTYHVQTTTVLFCIIQHNVSEA